MLDAAPQPFHKNVVEGAPATVHANGDALALEHPGKAVTGELGPLGRC